MNREETKKILTVISAVYPNFKVEDKTATIDAWNMMLSDHSYQDIALAVKTFVNTSGKGFPPSVDQLIAMTRKPMELMIMGEGEAWSLVEEAIKKSSYYAEEEFEKLKQINPMIAKALGSPIQLQTWARDSSYNSSVVSSNFMRAYKAVVQREKEQECLPIEVKQRMLELQNVALGIGVKDE